MPSSYVTIDGKDYLDVQIDFNSTYTDKRLLCSLLVESDSTLKMKDLMSESVQTLKTQLIKYEGLLIPLGKLSKPEVLNLKNDPDDGDRVRGKYRDRDAYVRGRSNVMNDYLI